jgi:hypothetical protein
MSEQSRLSHAAWVASGSRLSYGEWLASQGPAFSPGDRVRHLATGKVGTVQGLAEPQHAYPGWWDVTVDGDDWPGGLVWHVEYMVLHCPVWCIQCQDAVARRGCLCDRCRG